ncbi:glycoside hydrolase superfamily [Xylaria telfairii]|nr:glycoside hydrolase superfamily [Xylaria telfairii]
MHPSRVSEVLLCLVQATSTVSQYVHGAACPSTQTVVYWGQNGGGTVENDLATYCTPTSGIDIIVLAFLYQFGNGNSIPSGTIGQSCSIDTSGQGENCGSVASAIATCQAHGVKIILSLGGAVGSYSLQSASHAQRIGNYLWEAYGNASNQAVGRPFGKTVVDGFDFNIEHNDGNQFYQDMYYITGAPQCPIPEPNMGVVINGSQFDYLWPQFYNNNNYTYPCALPINGNAPFNYDQWISYTANTPSANAKIFIGVPAAPLAANGGPSGETYHATPEQLAAIVADIKDTPRFGGIMMWSAGFSDSDLCNDCTYAQNAKAILEAGAPCLSGPLRTTTERIRTSAGLGSVPWPPDLDYSGKTIGTYTGCAYVGNKDGAGKFSCDDVTEFSCEVDGQSQEMFSCSYDALIRKVTSVPRIKCWIPA